MDRRGKIRVVAVEVLAAGQVEAALPAAQQPLPHPHRIGRRHQHHVGRRGGDGAAGQRAHERHRRGELLAGDAAAALAHQLHGVLELQHPGDDQRRVLASLREELFATDTNGRIRPA